MADVARGSPSKTLAALAPGILCPVLLLHGEQDNVIPLASARKLYQLMVSKGHRSQLQVFAKTGHMIPEYQAAEAAKWVLDFLETEGSAAETAASSV